MLVCDDDPAMLEVAAAVLEDEGIRTVTARSGEEALELARERLPDAAVVDLLMPGMSGWQLGAALRREAGGRRLPVIIVSALDERRTDPVAADVVAWLPKPMDPADLLAGVERALGRQSRVDRTGPGLEPARAGAA